MRTSVSVVLPLAHLVRWNVVNAQGVQQTITQPFYASNTMLATDGAEWRRGRLYGFRYRHHLRKLYALQPAHRHPCHGDEGCTIAATPIAFGTYSNVAKTSTSTLSAMCTKGTGYSIGLDAGTASGATVAQRAMTGPGSAQLAYNLFVDSGHAIVWGNTPGADTAAGSGSGGPQAFIVYGLLNGGQTGVPRG